MNVFRWTLVFLTMVVLAEATAIFAVDVATRTIHCTGTISYGSERQENVSGKMIHAQSENSTRYATEAELGQPSMGGD